MTKIISANLLVRAQKKFLSILYAIIMMILAWQLGKLIAVQFEVPQSWSMPLLNASVQKSTVTGVDSFVFGEPAKTMAPIASKVVKPMVNNESVVASKLKLTLLGLIDLGEQGVAIIQNGAKTQVVAVNEAIMPKVILLDVFAEGILIDNRGQKERILMAQGVTPLVPQQKSEVAAPNITGRLSQAEQVKLNEIGDTLRKSPMSISKFIKFQPLNEKGQWVGVKIWSNSDAQLYKTLGFAEGDILREVNGHTIADMVKDPKLWQTFLSLDQFDLVVDRNGSPQMINVNFR